MEKSRSPTHDTFEVELLLLMMTTTMNCCFHRWNDRCYDVLQRRAPACSPFYTLNAVSAIMTVSYIGYPASGCHIGSLSLVVSFRLLMFYRLGGPANGRAASQLFGCATGHCCLLLPV